MKLSNFLIISGSTGCMFFAVFLTALFVSDLWDNLLQLRYQGLFERCLQLRLKRSLLESLLRWWSLTLGTGAAVLGFYAGAWPLAITWLLLWSGAPVLIMQAMIQRRENLLETQLTGAARGLANTIRAGLTVHQGLISVASESPAPLQIILRQIVHHFEHGRPLPETLRECRCQVQHDPFTMFCLALEVSLERGGRVNQALEQLATSLQEWHRIRRRLDAETAAGRFAVLILSLSPLGFGLMFWLAGIDGIHAFLTTIGGQCVLSVVLLLIMAGNRWAARIMKLSLT
jgi:Flp pilus assembly protein TadB